MQDESLSDIRNRVYQEEKARLEKVEQERAFLKNKDIGGHAPRPSDAFIDKSLGKQLSPREIAVAASQKAEAAAEKAERVRKEREAQQKGAQQQRNQGGDRPDGQAAARSQRQKPAQHREAAQKTGAMEKFKSWFRGQQKARARNQGRGRE